MREQNQHRMRFNIRNKLLTGFLALFAILLITVTLTLLQLNTIEKFTVRLRTQIVPLFTALFSVDADSESASSDFRGWLLAKDPALKKEFDDKWVIIEKDINTIDKNEETVFANNQTAAKEWKILQPLLIELKVAQQKAIQMNENATDNKATIDFFSKEVTPLRNKVQNLLGDLNDPEAGGLVVDLNKQLESEQKSLTHNIDLLITMEWILLILGIALSIIITWLTSRSIVNPILSAIDLAQRIAHGERDLKIIIKGGDETTDLLTALRDMHSGIVGSEGKLKESEETIQGLLSDLKDRIKQYRDYISNLSEGDLTKRLVVDGDDDLAKLGEHLNSLAKNLTKITLQISEATNEISTGLIQLESAATSQAASASEQATSVAEVISVVEEIKATTRQTLDKASALGKSAEKTHKEGEKGQESVDKMSESMQSLKDKIQQITDTILGLSDKTQKIGEITDVVSDIAKQSKMLALNASIEAAKAGESGKGFAVVAVEVKALAEKSQASTERVKQILQDIREAAEHAVVITEAGSRSVESTLQQAKETGDIVNALAAVTQESSIASQQIVAAVREESVGIDQVVASISEIDKVTSQFSSSTEQTKKASVSLATVADKLKKSVSVYKLKNNAADNNEA